MPKRCSSIKKSCRSSVDNMASNKNIIWVDIETTGIEPLEETILEVAIIVTDKNLNILEETPPVVIHQTDEVLDGMDLWCLNTHGKSGLIDECRESDLSMREADELLAFLVDEYSVGGKLPMAGNSVHFDRAFIKVHMPRLFRTFHYRNIDVSTLYELYTRWCPERISNDLIAHRALDDIQRSVEYLRRYREELTF